MLSTLDLHAARGRSRIAVWQAPAARLWGGREHVLLHRLNMPLHRLTSQFRVMPLDGNEDLSVGRQRFVGTTRGLQGFLPYGLENLDD
jgi:hypothetical protein